MHRQKTLPLDGRESRDALWERFPEEGRREVSCLYARLIATARAARLGWEASDARGKLAPVPCRRPLEP
jgi:hypothetical protein